MSSSRAPVNPASTSHSYGKGVSHDTPRIRKENSPMKNALRRTHPGLPPALRAKMGRTRGTVENERAIGKNEPKNTASSFSNSWSRQQSWW